MVNSNLLPVIVKGVHLLLLVLQEGDILTLVHLVLGARGQNGRRVVGDVQMALVVLASKSEGVRSLVAEAVLRVLNGSHIVAGLEI